VRYVLRTVIGLALMLLCATLMAYALYQLLQVGTCASGGPYVSARECPAGTERLIIAFFPAVLGLIAGAVVYGGRGDPPGSEGGGRRVNAFILVWILIFCGLSFASFWGVWGPDANPGPGGELGGLIVAFLFALMGLGAVPFIAPRRTGPAARQAAMERIAGRVTPRAWQHRASGVPPSAKSSAAAGGGDVVSKLERANRLRAEGALTEAEFEKLKAEILGGGG
jgi:hypothetical protein